MYSSEIFPQKYREVGMSLAVAINLSFAGALAMAVPQYQENLNDEGRHLVLLGSFAALDFVAAILVWLLMRYPERAVELEDMNVSIFRHYALYVGFQINREYRLCLIHLRSIMCITNYRLHGV